MDFETTIIDGPGVPEISRAHSDFMVQENVIAGFSFGIWAFNNNQEKVAGLVRRVVQAHSEEVRQGVITELDRLRDEYVQRKRPHHSHLNLQRVLTPSTSRSDS
jgi:hypothetical protein